MKQIRWFYTKGKTFASLLFFFIVVSHQAQADLPECAEVFSNGVQTFGPGSYVHLDYNAQIINLSSKDLNTASVQSHPWSVRKSCGTDQCEATGQELPRLFDERELQTDATTEFVVPPHKKLTIGATEVNHFGRVAVSQWATAVFSSNHAVYVIDRLDVGYKSSLRLPAGEYWVRDLRLEVESRIDVIGEGTVNLYVIDSLLVPLNVKLNENTKNPAQMTIYTYSASEFYVGSQTYAFLRTDNEVLLHHRAKITGGVLAQFVDLRTESQIAYHAAAARTLAFNNICRASGVVPPVDVTPPEITEPMWYEEPGTNRGSITVTVRDVGEDASGLATVFLQSPTGDLPMQVNGDTYTVDVRLVPGGNFYTVIARDNAGNESSLEEGGYFISEPQFENMVYPDTWRDPVALVTGEIHTYWPLEDLVLRVDRKLTELIPVREGVYRFEVNYPLQPWMNRFYITVYTPDNNVWEHRADIFYYPSGFYVTVDQHELVTDAATVALTGYFGMPDEEVLGVYATSENFPEEIPVAYEQDTADRYRFSVEVPLALGINYINVRIDSVPGLFPWSDGATITRTASP